MLASGHQASAQENGFKVTEMAVGNQPTDKRVRNEGNELPTMSAPTAWEKPLPPVVVSIIYNRRILPSGNRQIAPHFRENKTYNALGVFTGFYGLLYQLVGCM